VLLESVVQGKSGYMESRNCNKHIGLVSIVPKIYRYIELSYNYYNIIFEMILMMIAVTL